MRFALRLSYQKMLKTNIQTSVIKVNYGKHFHIWFTVLLTNRWMCNG